MSISIQAIFEKGVFRPYQTTEVDIWAELDAINQKK